MNLSNIPFLKNLAIFSLIAAFTGTMFLGGCDSDQVSGPDFEYEDISRVEIYPRSVELEAGDNEDFTFFLLTEEGDTIDTDKFDIETEWWSTDTNVFTVEENGFATSHEEGEAYCVIDITVHSGDSNFGGRDSTLVFVF